MQVDIREQGADDLPLSGARLGDQELTVFDNASVNPFPNQAQEAAVANPSLDERHELVTHDRVEVALDVCFEHIRHRFAANRAANGVECVVWAEARPETVGAWKKVLLVNRREHRYGGLLDDLVLQGRNRDRSLFSVFLRDIDPPQ